MLSEDVNVYACGSYGEGIETSLCIPTRLVITIDDPNATKPAKKQTSNCTHFSNGYLHVMHFADIRDAMAWVAKDEQSAYLCPSSVPKLMQYYGFEGLPELPDGHSAHTLDTYEDAKMLASMHPIHSQIFTDNACSCFRVFLEDYVAIELVDDKNNADQDKQRCLYDDEGADIVGKRALTLGERRMLFGGPIPPTDPYAIDLDALRAGIDGRTTVMLRNLPPRLTQSQLVDLLLERVGPCFDFVYLRRDWRGDINVGYAFINVSVVSASSLPQCDNAPLDLVDGRTRHNAAAVVSFVRKMEGWSWPHARSDSTKVHMRQALSGIEFLRSSNLILYLFLFSGLPGNFCQDSRRQGSHGTLQKQPPKPKPQHPRLERTDC